MFSKLKHPCDLPKVIATKETFIYCGLCGTAFFNWETVRCERCECSIQMGRPQLGKEDGVAQIFYYFYQWRVSYHSKSTYEKRKLNLVNGIDIERLDTRIIISLDRIAGVSMGNWLSELETKDKVKYSRFESVIEYCNIKHKLLIKEIIELAKLFVGTRSKATLYTILIEMGQITKDMLHRLERQPILMDIVGAFSNAITGLMNDAERAFEMNKRIE